IAFAPGSTRHSCDSSCSARWKGTNCPRCSSASTTKSAMTISPHTFAQELKMARFGLSIPSWLPAPSSALSPITGCSMRYSASPCTNRMSTRWQPTSTCSSPDWSKCRRTVRHREDLCDEPPETTSDCHTRRHYFLCHHGPRRVSPQQRGQERHPQSQGHHRLHRGAPETGPGHSPDLYRRHQPQPNGQSVLTGSRL